MKQPRRVAGLHGVEGDAVGGQVEVEIGEAHGAVLASKGPPATKIAAWRCG